MQIEIGNNDLNPWLPGNGSFGLYNWRQNPVNGNPLPWVSPFTNGAKIGHCVELEQGSATTNGTLRSGADLRLDNPTNTIAPGNTDARVAQIQWLLQSSYRAAALNDANFQNGVTPGAHQSAIWKITNPNDAANDIGASGSAQRIAADALADQLLAAAVANSGAIDQSSWSVIDPGRQRADLYWQHAYGAGQGQPEHGGHADHHRRHGALRQRHPDHRRWCWAPTAPARSI